MGVCGWRSWYPSPIGWSIRSCGALYRVKFGHDVWWKRWRLGPHRGHEREIQSHEEAARLCHLEYLWPCGQGGHTDPSTKTYAKVSRRWSVGTRRYFCNREVQELSKTFHYAWLLLSIVLVAWELLEDSQFPSVTSDLPEAVKYASLWATKDAQHIKDSKIF